MWMIYAVGLLVILSLFLSMVAYPPPKPTWIETEAPE